MRSTTLHVKIQPATSFNDIFWMRDIRNQVARFMTHNDKPIGLFRQIWWYLTTYRKTNIIQGFLVWNGDQPIGYGLVTLRPLHNDANDLVWMVSGGLIDEYRGRGIGRQLFQFMTDHVLNVIGAQECYLDVLDSNEAGKALYHKIGYRTYDVQTIDGRTIVFMVHKGGR